MTKKHGFWRTAAMAMAALVCALVLTGCPSPSGPGGVYAVGDTGPGGGKIFYVSEVGFDVSGVTCHYLEAAPSDIGGGTQVKFWMPGGSTSAVFAPGTAIGTGKANTAALPREEGGTVLEAAQACKDYTADGKSDWFLPSKDELNELYRNRAVVGNLITRVGPQAPGVGIAAQYGYYWSSTEYDRNMVWFQKFIISESGIQSYTGKNTGYSVRPVRAF